MKKRILYIDLIKIFAIFGPILIHITSQVFNDCSVFSNRYLALSIFNGIGRCGVPLFLMCSGALLLGKNISKKKIYTKYIPRFLISFIAFQLIYCFINNNLDFNYTLLNWYKKINSSHLWYLIMIMAIYCVIPILNIFINNAKKEDIKYFLILAFIFQSLLFFISEFDIFVWVKRYYRHLYIPLVNGYVGYLILGYYINKFNINKKTKIISIILGIISLIILVFSNVIYSRNNNLASVIFSSNFGPFVVLYAISMFIIIKEICFKFENIINTKLISYISNCTFGIYLIHMIIINAMNYYEITALNYNAFIFVPLASILVYILSLILIIILKKIPLIRNLIT